MRSLAVCLSLASAISFAAVGNPAGTVPAGMPARLVVGLQEEEGRAWMKNSGVPWDARYRYLVRGWVNNFGWGAADGSFALNYMRECQAQGRLPAFSYYQMQNEPGGGESAFYAKTQNATTMRSYFSDFKLLMQRAKDFGAPVLVLVEPDGTGLLESQTGHNSNAPAAVASTGLPELAGLPNTVGGWGQAFLRMRSAVGATNVILGLHVSGWATGHELFNFSATVPLQPHVDQAYAFLTSFGLAQYDVLVADPLDRDADYYRLVQGNQQRWWDMSDSASINSASFNRYAEWLRLWNLKSGKRWVLWQIPEGTSAQSNVCASSAQRSGYRDNRSEYFFGPNGAAHREKFATAGVAALLFGRGEPCQSTHETDGDYLKNNAGAFLRAGGLAIPRGAGGGTTPPPPPPPATPVWAVTATVSGSTVTARVTGGAPAYVIVEVHGASGRVAQQQCNQAATCDLTFSSTTAGTYTVKAGAFDAAWSLLVWNDAAAAITVSGAPLVRYDFEGGAQGWTGGSMSTARAYSGTRSLAVNITSARAVPQIANPPIAAGKRVTFRLWIPATAQIASVQPYVMETGTWRWTSAWISGSTLTKGAWNTLSVTVPANAAPLAQLGLEIAPQGTWRGTVYVDAVTD